MRAGGFVASRRPAHGAGPPGAASSGVLGWDFFSLLSVSCNSHFGLFFWNGREGERAAVCAFAGCSLLSCSAAVRARGQGGVSFHEGLSSACFSIGFPHSGARS